MDFLEDLDLKFRVSNVAKATEESLLPATLAIIHNTDVKSALAGTNANNPFVFRGEGAD
jgi:hypothetical protein